MPSPHPSSGSGPGGARPPLMKRHSSQQSHGSGKQGHATIISPGSDAGPLRHHVKGPVRKTKIVLPRNNSSARNLARLGANGQGHGRKRSGEGGGVGEGGSGAAGEGIRLPGSLGDAAGEGGQKPQMRRNLTSSHLPRNTSHTKLKKNLSHGQLARIGSGRNLQGLNTTRGPPSPGLKGKSRKKRSLDSGYPEKDLHEQEMEIARQQQAAKEGPRRVGFAVGDGNESSEEEGPQMEGSGLQEDEWTDQSASASPATTRQNTANNSRRPSVSGEGRSGSGLRDGVSAEVKTAPRVQFGGQQEPVRQDVQQLQVQQTQPQPQPAPEADGTPPASGEDESEDDDEDEDDPPSPRSMPHSHKARESQRPPPSEPPAPQPAPPPQNTTSRSPLHAAKDHPNPFTKQLLNRNNHNPAPALVSNVSAMDESRSARGSPAASMRSSRSNIADHQEDELVSRFIPSASHPTTSSGGNTTMNTPKIGSYQTPESESHLASQHREKPAPTSHAPTSPGSTLSASSGATTPAILRSRTELRMANERAMAEIEGSGKPQLMIPAHRFDRRNESLKSYLHSARLERDGSGAPSLGGSGLVFGPEIFEGRFKAVNTELKVVQRFRDPLAESLERLRRSQGKGKKGAGGVRPADKVPITSKSAVNLAKQGSGLGNEEGSSVQQAKSASPAKSAMLASKSAVNVGRSGGHGGHGRGGSGRVKFSHTPPEVRDGAGGGKEDLSGADGVAKMLWDAASGKA